MCSSRYDLKLLAFFQEFDLTSQPLEPLMVLENKLYIESRPLGTNGERMIYRAVDLPWQTVVLFFNSSP